MQIFKPNSANTGAALSFRLDFSKTDTLSLFASLVKQASWNAQTKTGSFAANADKGNPNNINVKFSLYEICAFIRSFETGVPFSAYHTSSGGTTVTVSMKTFEHKPKEGATNQEPTTVWGLQVIKNKTEQFKCPISLDEAVGIREYLRWGLMKYFSQQLTEQAKYSQGGNKKPEEKVVPFNKGNETKTPPPRNVPPTRKPTQQETPPPPPPQESEEEQSGEVVDDSDPFSGN